MRNIRKETVERKIRESETGFKHVKENRTHSLYEKKRNAYGAEEDKLEETGAGAAGDEKLVTPDGKELESLKEVFDWIDEHYPDEGSLGEKDSRYEKSEPVIKTRSEFGKIDEDQFNYANR